MPGKKSRSSRLLTELADQLDRQFEGETELQELSEFLNSRDIRAAMAAHETLRRLEKQKRKAAAASSVSDSKSAFPEVARTDFIQTLRAALDSLESAAAGTNDEACELYDLLASPRMTIFIDALEDIGHRNYEGEPPLLGRIASRDLVECNVDEAGHQVGPISRENLSLQGGDATLGSLAAEAGNQQQLQSQQQLGHNWAGVQEDDLDEFGRPQKMIAFNKIPGEDLGITVGTIEWYDDNTGQSGLDIVVERIMAGSRIEQQNTLKPYDVIKEVNGIPIDSPEKLQQVMKKASGSITLKVRSGFYESTKPVQEAFTYVKALFSYDPQFDGLLPCREAGLKFTVGDILQVLSQEDPNWWQARQWNSRGRAGLIPSLTMQERRAAFVQSAPDKDAINYKVMGLGLTSKKRTVRVTFKANVSQKYERSDLTIYQEVARVPPFRRSLVLLLGAPGIGKYSLIDHLIRQHPESYARPIPHTSRPPRDGEVNGEKYLFAGRPEMEVDIRRGGYMQYGELNGQLYGIKVDTLRSMAKQERTLIVDCPPDKAKIVCTAEFKPFVVFVAAPSFDCMKSMYELGSSLGLTNKIKRDEDFRRSIQESVRIERSYRHLFDAVLICDNFEACYEQLEALLDSLNKEHQWLPVNWLY